MISETKIDSSFPSVQLHLEVYVTPCRLDKNVNGDGILLYIGDIQKVRSIKIPDF